jgi:uncharacterized protein (TIGR02284 family)
MKNSEQVLQNMIRIARSGRDFFAAVYPRVTDPEVRMAFTYVTDVKNRLINDLSRFVPQVEEDSNDRTSPAAVVERAYAEARRGFRGAAPADAGNALSIGEVQLCKLLERAFEEAESPGLRRVLKSHYAELMLCRQAMWRLQARRAA